MGGRTESDISHISDLYSFAGKCSALAWRLGTISPSTEGIA